MSQQALGREYHERGPPCGERLPPEHVKVLDRRGGLADLEIVLGGELEESLDTGTRMLWALTLVAMWQQECQPRQPPPLVFSRGDELIDDDLRVVREVPELSFPRVRVSPGGRGCTRYSNPRTAASDNGEL